MRMESFFSFKLLLEVKRVLLSGTLSPGIADVQRLIGKGASRVDGNCFEEFFSPLGFHVQIDVEAELLHRWNGIRL